MTMEMGTTAEDKSELNTVKPSTAETILIAGVRAPSAIKKEAVFLNKKTKNYINKQNKLNLRVIPAKMDTAGLTSKINLGVLFPLFNNPKIK
jgi:hypothetical protein